MRAKFFLWRSDKDGNWYWHLKSMLNGNIICWAEGYSSKQAALESIEWVRDNAMDSSIEYLS